MQIFMTKITVNMGNNLRKSYSNKYERHARLFATSRPDLVVAGQRRKKEKKKKKKQKKKPRPKTLGIRPTDGMPN